MIIFVMYCNVMQPPPVMWMLNPRPSRVLKELKISSWERRISMLEEKTIQRGSDWMTA